jgi:hypothetical protein
MEVVKIPTIVMLEEIWKKLQVPNQNTRFMYYFCMFSLLAHVCHSDGTM